MDAGFAPAGALCPEDSVCALGQSASRTCIGLLRFGTILRARHSSLAAKPNANVQDVASLRSEMSAVAQTAKHPVIRCLMIVTGASQAGPERRGPDDIRHEIVFRASDAAIHCYRIKLTPAAAPDLQRSQCEIFDRHSSPVEFDLVPIPDCADDGREYLLFFRRPGGFFVRSFPPSLRALGFRRAKSSR